MYAIDGLTFSMPVHALILCYLGAFCGPCTFAQWCQGRRLRRLVYCKGVQVRGVKARCPLKFLRSCAQVLKCNDFSFLTSLPICFASSNLLISLDATGDESRTVFCLLVLSSDVGPIWTPISRIAALTAIPSDQTQLLTTKPEALAQRAR